MENLDLFDFHLGPQSVFQLNVAGAVFTKLLATVDLAKWESAAEGAPMFCSRVAPHFSGLHPTPEVSVCLGWCNSISGVADSGKQIYPFSDTDLPRQVFGKPLHEDHNHDTPR